MSFKKIVESLQKGEENEGFLVLIRCGVFFLGVGKDAVILTENLGVTNTCFAEGICKSSIPVCKIDKMISKIVSRNISVVIYDYNPKGLEKDKNKKVELLRRIVMSPIEENRKCLECEKCIYNDARMKSSIASTEEIVKGIDSILENKYGIIDIAKNTSSFSNEVGSNNG